MHPGDSDSLKDLLRHNYQSYLAPILFLLQNPSYSVHFGSFISLNKLKPCEIAASIYLAERNATTSDDDGVIQYCLKETGELITHKGLQTSKELQKLAKDIICDSDASFAYMRLFESFWGLLSGLAALQVASKVDLASAEEQIQELVLGVFQLSLRGH